MSADEPTEWAVGQARAQGPSLRLWEAEARYGADIDHRERMVAKLARILDAAREEGHRRAVEETAIHSIHKAVAAARADADTERRAIVARLRGVSVTLHKIGEAGYSLFDFYADEIESGAFKVPS